VFRVPDKVKQLIENAFFIDRRARSASGHASDVAPFGASARPARPCHAGAGLV